MHAPSQWETTLHCNVVSHWFGTYTKWPLLGPGKDCMRCILGLLLQYFSENDVGILRAHFARYLGTAGGALTGWQPALHDYLRSQGYPHCNDFRSQRITWGVTAVFPQILTYLRTTVRCRNNAVSFHQNSRKRHTIARPNGRAMVCLLWIEYLIYILPLSLQCSMQYIFILNHIISALNYFRK